MSIRQRLEDVRQQRDQLAPVPGAEQGVRAVAAGREPAPGAGRRGVRGLQAAARGHRARGRPWPDSRSLRRPKRRNWAPTHGPGRPAKELRELEPEYNDQGGNAISAIDSRWRMPGLACGSGNRWRKQRARPCPTPACSLMVRRGLEQAHEQAAAGLPSSRTIRRPCRTSASRPSTATPPRNASWRRPSRNSSR